jgi:hypothetical protein
MESAAYWSVGKEFFDPMYNYLIYGYHPGSFFTSLLANDLFGAIPHSHPGNSIEALKHLCGWIQDKFPTQAWGSYDRVDKWTELTTEQRRRLLESKQLIYTEQDEIMLGLRGEKTVEPMLW